MLRGDLSRLVFFFQAEDGIRDYKVTGVQTCALPIFSTSTVEKLESLDMTDIGSGIKWVVQRNGMNLDNLLSPAIYGSGYTATITQNDVPVTDYVLDYQTGIVTFVSARPGAAIRMSAWRPAM